MVRIIVGENDLITTNPELCKEWDNEKNSIEMREVTAGSHKKVWWKCSENHQWEAEIKSRVNGHKCPYCSGRRAITGKNDLLVMNPELIEQWNYEKNKGLSPNSIIAKSGKKVWWICKNGHEWSAVVSSRIAGRGCPQCVKERATSFPEQAVFYYIKKYFSDTINGYKDDIISEIDVFIPSESCGIEYDGQFFHKNKERDNRKDKIADECGIKLFRVIEDSNRKYDKSIYHRLGNVFYYEPKNVDTLSSIIYAILIELGCRTDKDVINVQRDRIDIWNQYIDMEKSNSLKSLCPEIALEWHKTKNRKITADMASYKSGKKVWWKCKTCHFEWMATIAHRTNGTGCPICANKDSAERANKLVSGSNDLKTMCPEIAKEWNYVRNKELMPSQVYFLSNKSVWWKCNACGNEFKASINARTRLNTKCRKC